MKQKILFVSIFIVLLFSFAALAALAQEGDEPEQVPEEGQNDVPDVLLANVSTAVTYQGYLEQNGVPVNGNCDFQTNLYDAVTGGVFLGLDLVLNVAVDNGRFTLILNDQGEFAANALNGQGRWLELIVRCPTGSGGYTTLTPRQPLYAVPYAHSLRPGAIIDGSTGTNVGVLNLTGSSDALRVSSATGDGLTVETAADAALEITTSHDGVRVDNANDDGMEITHAGNDGVVITRADDEGIQVLDAGGAGVWARTSNNADYGGYFLNSGDTAAEGVGVYARGNTNTAPDIVLAGSSNGSDDGVLRSDPAYLGSDLFLTSNDAVVVRLDDDGNADATNDPADFIVEIYDHGTNTAEHLFRVSNNGFTTVQVLEITGGADLSEQFDVGTHRDVQPEPGMVVCIDAQNPGELIVCDNAYDRTVAGVISGAGDIQPGMLMGQDGSAADGQYPVALTGRVYVWADAGEGVIHPGDLLTTSAVPGFAARVDDHAEAQGAILGKAMTALDSEQGLVLMLVTLQ